MLPKQFPKAGYGASRKKQMGGGWKVAPSVSREERLAARAERMTTSAQATQHLVRPGAMLALDAGASVQACPKDDVVRCEAYRRLVACLPCAWCGICGRSQHAHENMGKGMGLKVDDRRGLPLCCDHPGRAGCHPAFDQYRLLSGGREAHRTWGARMAAATRALILKSGQWPKHLPQWAEDTTGSTN
ncbi:hypothetical protein [Pantoea sp. 18069]|uniref:hypothetical protein n=1 Tax=Pantoea sp. 18069 TaxID=2681415 RepID=UPI00190F6B59|nr:hypothetical protein [Pantoea sp. 18069]